MATARWTLLTLAFLHITGPDNDMNRKHYLFFMVILAVLFSPGISFAEEMLFMPSHGDIQEGEFIKVNVYVAPGGERINAAEGKLIFPSDLLAVSDINFGNSFLSFWREQPHSEKPGLIVFSGVAPGGYESPDKGLLFSVIFRGARVGRAELRITDEAVLKDDGAGSAAEVRLQQGSITIAKKDRLGESDSSRELSRALDPKNDGELPESFVPLVGSTPALFGGKHFIVFATADKQSGIDRYEVEESLRQSVDDTKWIRAESPYELSDQTLQSFVFVKAVDKAGNARVAMVWPKHARKFYEYGYFWVILIVILAALFILALKRRLTKNLSHHES